jgi:hypothetical protein
MACSTAGSSSPSRGVFVPRWLILEGGLEGAPKTVGFRVSALWMLKAVVGQRQLLEGIPWLLYQRSTLTCAWIVRRAILLFVALMKMVFLPRDLSHSAHIQYILFSRIHLVLVRFWGKNAVVVKEGVDRALKIALVVLLGSTTAASTAAQPTNLQKTLCFWAGASDDGHEAVSFC